MPDPKKLDAVFYRTAAGSEPVREWLRGFEPGDRKRLGIDIAKVEFGWPIGMPYCRAMGDGLWEVRSDISSNRTVRVLFGIVAGQMVLLHGFVKKAQATPKSELDLGRQRLKEVRNG